MRKKVLVKVICSLLICIMAVGFSPRATYADETVQAVNPFTDVSEEAYYYDAVMWALGENITTGMTATTFGVQGKSSRAQGVTFLWRTQDCPESSLTELSFKDVKKGEYFYDAVCWGVENGIVNGQTQNEFAPMQIMTRGQFITFLYRTVGKPETTIENPFSDISEKDYYYDAVLWAVENNITNGTSEETFSPNAECMREAVVTFLYRAFYVEEDTEDDTEQEEEFQFTIEDPSVPVDATEYGLSAENEGERNSKILQALIDALTKTGGTIYIPEGEYYFCENGKQTIGSHCIKMQSNITIKGAGDTTILKPAGQSRAGLDMFYFNEYVDTGEAVYLENCRFEDFVIDAAETSCQVYTSAGKGFMFNLFKECYWSNVTVKNTDATGFGVDCPIGGSMVNCVAVNCGKAATTFSTGASGFGIGFGYSSKEYFSISDCRADDNKIFGFFFEHQERFSSTKYTAKLAILFNVNNCEASGNYFNFGGLHAMNVTYVDCVSTGALQNGYHFENSKNCKVVNCSSEQEANASFTIIQSGKDGGTQDVNNIVYKDCISTQVPYGAVIKSYDSYAVMSGNMIKNCVFSETQESVIVTEGNMDGLILMGNDSDLNENSYNATIEEFIDMNNSWNGLIPQIEETTLA